MDTVVVKVGDPQSKGSGFDSLSPTVGVLVRDAITPPPAPSRPASEFTVQVLWI